MERGVEFQRKVITTLRQLQSLSRSSTTVNASGLVARTLAPDSNVLPIRRQTMVIKSLSNEAVLLQGSQYTYATPEARVAVLF